MNQGHAARQCGGAAGLQDACSGMSYTGAVGQGTRECCEKTNISNNSNTMSTMKEKKWGLGSP